MADAPTGWVAGVDGCKSGWVAVLCHPTHTDSYTLTVFREFAELLAHVPELVRIAVDMPIGLPDRVGLHGRGPEKAVREHLRARQSSVFSIPSRQAVYADQYREACEISQSTSEPPKKVSKQAFYLFPKIRQIDALMTPSQEGRVFEVHPELAFWRLNGGREMSQPKKIKSRANPEGLDQRRELLCRHAMPQAFLDQPRPSGVGRDDLLDAAANCLIAKRLLDGMAEPFPQDFLRDGKGLRMAIWA